MIPAHIARQAVLLDGVPRQALNDAIELAALERQQWHSMLRDLREGGDPLATRQYFRELIADPPVANQTPVAAAADTILWDAATLTPIAANAIRAGQMFKVTAFGVTTTAVTGSQTLIINPRFGTTTSGTLLGASRTAPVNAAAKTNVPWFLQMWVHFRSTGSSGTAVCGGTFDAETVIGTAATTNSATVAFGTSSTTPTAVNTTTASGLVVSVTPSLNTQTFTTLGVAMESLN